MGCGGGLVVNRVSSGQRGMDSIFAPFSREHANLSEVSHSEKEWMLLKIFFSLLNSQTALSFLPNTWHLCHLMPQRNQRDDMSRDSNPCQSVELHQTGTLEGRSTD